MAYTLDNKCAKNLCKRTVLVQVIIENVVTCFLRHSACSTYRRRRGHICSVEHNVLAFFIQFSVLLFTITFSQKILVRTCFLYKSIEI